MIGQIKALVKPPLLWLSDITGPHRRGGEPRLWILMYHRVLPESDPRFALEEPGMVVTPETLAMHCRQLKQHMTVMRLKDWLELADKHQPLPERACAITFDDGWRDNLEYALPVLQEQQLPATVFAVSDWVGTHYRFWPNRIQSLIAELGPDWWRHPATQELHALAPAIQSDDADDIAALIDACKHLSDAELHALLDQCESALSTQAETQAAKQADLMSWEELAQLQASGVFDVASHGCSHTRLTPSLDPATCAYEVGASKVKLANHLEQTSPLFCYPNGDVSEEALKQVRAHYQAAVTTRMGINDLDSDRYQLCRVGVQESNSNTALAFRARLSGRWS